jgi:glycosyltransferase involved in cell wall biosynthesis
MTPEISAIVLGYRAGDQLGQVVAPLHRQLTESGVSYELVIVANYWPDSGDTTPDEAQRFKAAHDRVVVVAEPKDGGMGWDMRTGLAAASGNYLIVMDGDAQNPVEDILAMYHHMKDSGVQMMKGRRTTRFDGLYRRVITTVYNALFRVLFGTKGLWDINGKPKALTRKAYESITLKSDDWFIDAEIVLAVKRAGLPIAEMPVVFGENETRASFVRPVAIVEFVANMLRARARRR